MQLLYDNNVTDEGMYSLAESFRENESESLEYKIFTPDISHSITINEKLHREGQHHPNPPGIERHPQA